MALPIEPTPILKGKDAKRFWKEMNRKKSKKETEINRKLMEESIRTYQYYKEQNIKNPWKCFICGKPMKCIRKDKYSSEWKWTCGHMKGIKMMVG